MLAREFLARQLLLAKDYELLPIWKKFSSPIYSKDRVSSKIGHCSAHRGTEKYGRVLENHLRCGAFAPTLVSSLLITPTKDDLTEDTEEFSLLVFHFIR